MHPLPPLNALRAFEAAARTGGFASAGRELGVTSAAVSQQVRALEDQLGKGLFVRRGNRLTLTDAGLSLYPRLGEAFAMLSEIAASASLGPARRGLIVSVAPSMMGWLLPRLAAHRAAEGGGGRVELRAEDDPVAFGREGADLRLTYDGAHYGEYRVETLFRDAAVPVVSPAVWRAAEDREGPLSSLPDAMFVHTDWGRDYASHPTWAAWMARAGLGRAVDPARGVQVSWSAHAAAAAEAGLGAALVPLSVAGPALAEGRLVSPSPVHLPLERPHVAVWPQALARRSDLAALLAHLRAG
ncbi:MAG: LysR family transcriptional regulator [Rhodobacteraceae bacterium]|jgi:LysR family glycine cleavage system transcriptional activator|nr:LysR family transcriptional regulator [Paracoccaceae bacterium]